MYINPFLAGILVTLNVEMALLFVAAFWKYTGGKKK